MYDKCGGTSPPAPPIQAERSGNARPFRSLGCGAKPHVSRVQGLSPLPGGGGVEEGDSVTLLHTGSILSAKQ
jgi:hypothetical protein